MILSILTSPAVVGLIAGVPSIAVGFLVYRRSVKADNIAAQAGIATVQSGTVGQVIDGLNKLVENLQDDNEVLRGNIVSLNDKLDKIITQCAELKAEIARLNKRLARKQRDQ